MIGVRPPKKSHMLQLREPPKYLQRAAIYRAPCDFPWKGSLDHVGPMETVTPLLNRIAGKTGLAEVTLFAGVLEWGAWRLRGFVGPDPSLQLLEAAFAYQVDFRYANADAIVIPVPESPPAESASRQLLYLGRQIIYPEYFWMAYSTPVREVFHAIHLVRHILPKAAKKQFSDWLDVVINRLDSVAAVPEEEDRNEEDFNNPADYQVFLLRHHGEALPREILDPDVEYDHNRRKEFVERFLTKLDWQTNPYLRSPEEMLKLGFEGTPYKLR